MVLKFVKSKLAYQIIYIDSSLKQAMQHFILVDDYMFVGTNVVYWR